MVPEAVFPQASIDHVQSRSLFGDEEHRLARGKTRGNHVGDRLALSGSWRSNDHKVSALRGRKTCGYLRGICWQRHDDFGRGVTAINFVLVRERLGGGFNGALR